MLPQFLSAAAFFHSCKVRGHDLTNLTVALVSLHSSVPSILYNYKKKNNKHELKINKRFIALFKCNQVMKMNLLPYIQVVLSIQ